MNYQRISQTLFSHLIRAADRTEIIVFLIQKNTSETYSSATKQMLLKK